MNSNSNRATGPAGRHRATGQLARRRSGPLAVVAVLVGLFGSLLVGEPAVAATLSNASWEASSASTGAANVTYS